MKLRNSGNFSTLLYRYFPLVILLVFTWFRASAMLARVTDPDPGLFESFAYHILHGKVLYLDIWDHKPPLIFYLNLLFLKLFGSTEDAISYGSLFFALLQTVVIYRLFEKTIRNRYVIFAGTALFISTFFSVFVFGSGNYTEQYAVLLTSTGLLFFIDYTKTFHQKYLWYSGICFGISVWFKEPFVFSVVPYFIFLGYRAFFHTKKFSDLISFTLAFLAPALLTANLIVMTGGKEGYLEHLQHSRLYAQASNSQPLYQNLINNHSGFFHSIQVSNYLLIPLFLLCIITLTTSKFHRLPFILIIGQQLMDYLATGISGNQFFHYYLQTLPLTIFIIINGIYLISERLINKSFEYKAVPVVAFAISLLMVQKPWQNLSQNPEKHIDDKIVNYLNENEYYKPREIALAGKDIGFYLLRAKGISDVRYIVPYPYHWINIPGREVHHQMTADSARFMQWQPKYVIYSGTFSEMYQDCSLDSFILKNYYCVAKTDLLPDKSAYLLRKKDESDTE